MDDNRLLETISKAVPPENSGETLDRLKSELFRHKWLIDHIPSGGPSKRLLDVGGTGVYLPIYLDILDYGCVALQNISKEAFLINPEYRFNQDKVRFDIANAELDPFSYEDGYFDVVVCCEVLEHLSRDPMFMMSEISRVLKNGGLLFFTTPNVASIFSLYRLLSGKHPFSWSAYDFDDNDRHNREFTVDEIRKLLFEAGLEAVSIETLPLSTIPIKMKLLGYYCNLPWVLRGKGSMNPTYWGDTILAVARKTSGVRNRFPEWLYSKYVIEHQSK